MIIVLRDTDHIVLTLDIHIYYTCHILHYVCTIHIYIHVYCFCHVLHTQYSTSGRLLRLDADAREGVVVEGVRGEGVLVGRVTSREEPHHMYAGHKIIIYIYIIGPIFSI